jgi:hypothetical protein
VRIVNPHHAWTWPKQARKAAGTLSAIIILGVSVATMAGQGTAAVTAVIVAALTVAVEELLRAALRYWLRVV